MPANKTAKENAAPATTAAGAKRAAKAPAKTAKDTIPRNNVASRQRKVSENPVSDKQSVKSGAKQAEKPVDPPPKRQKGQLSTYSEAVAANICDLLAEGVPLREICRLPDMPAWRTVYAWRGAHPEFDALIARARVAGFDAIAEECLDIADNVANDTVQTENGERANAEWIQRSKLRIETRLKLLAKWDPKRFGDKVDVNHGVQPENPLTSLFSQISGTPLRPKKDGDE